MQWIGVKDIPTFDSGGIAGGPRRRKTLGEACGGVNIDRCCKFFNLNSEGLEAVACGICEVDRT